MDHSSRHFFIIMAAGASLLAAATLAASASSASADTVINAHYALTGSTFIKKLNTTVDLGAGTLAATVDLDTGAVASTLTLPPATVSMKELGVIPVSATAALVQNGPATGTANLTTNTITSSASVIFKITKLKVAGLNVPIGGNCQSAPFSVSLSSGPGFTVSGGGPLSGSYTIPPLHLLRPHHPGPQPAHPRTREHLQPDSGAAAARLIPEPGGRREPLLPG